MSSGRGAKATSADVAVRYRRPDGAIEITLIEWKYVEGTYERELSAGNSTRMARHKRRFDDPDGPILQEAVEYADLFVEPFYQLLRLALLANAMEQARELDAVAVRTVLAAPSRNEAFHGQIARPSLRAIGADVATIWRQLLRRPDRFISVDSAEIIARAADSTALVDRYGHLLKASDRA